MSIESYFKRALLQKRIVSDDSTVVPAFTTLVISGFIQPVSGGENLKQGKGGEDATIRFYTRMNVNAAYGDLVTQDNTTYMVLYGGFQVAGVSGRGHHKEFILGVFE